MVRKRARNVNLNEVKKREIGGSVLVKITGEDYLWQNIWLKGGVYYRQWLPHNHIDGRSLPHHIA